MFNIILSIDNIYHKKILIIYLYKKNSYKFNTEINQISKFLVTKKTCVSLSQKLKIN